MVELSEPNTEARKTRIVALSTKRRCLRIGHDFPRSKGERSASSAIEARAPDGQDALQTLKHRYVVVRHLARVIKGPRKP